MKRPGLTEAMRRDMEHLADITDRRCDKLCRAGMATMAVITSDGVGDGFRKYRKLTPRGQAALAAPRVTAAELAMLERLESWSGIVHGRDITTAANLHMRGLACAFKSGGFIKVRKTDAGTTALNNVRAASGSADYKETT